MIRLEPIKGGPKKPPVSRQEEVKAKLRRWTDEVVAEQGQPPINWPKKRAPAIKAGDKVTGIVPGEEWTIVSVTKKRAPYRGGTSVEATKPWLKEDPPLWAAALGIASARKQRSKAKWEGVGRRRAERLH